MKTYWIVVLAVYTTWITTLMYTKVGEMSSPPSVHTWTLPAMALFLTVVPALLGYLIGKEQA
jgi:hypothetical protein